MSPVSLFLLLCGTMAAMTVVFALSVWYYWRAKDLVPHLVQLKALKEEIAIAQESVARENQKVRDLQAKRALAERTIADGDAAKQYLEENRGKVEALRNDIEKFSAREQKAREQYQERQEELTQRQQELANLAAKLATEKQKESDISVRLEAQEARLEELKTDEGRTKADLEKLQGQRAQLSKETNELDAQCRRLQRELERLHAEASDVESRRKTALEQLVSAEEKAAVFSGEAAAAQRILSDLAATRKIDNDKWENLDLAVIGESGRKFASIDQTDWLRKFERLLEKHGFVFSGRTLRAFHTGLLCSQVTPLVVLSGISGTGKSLLPELYASALGLNFLPVPVQPRWDSPQDLFGFYNYMEGRYKATELARFLWQFDRNNKAQGSNTHPVNLVLLDEMNLARVEYYFSDLLSKLEIRNGIDPDNDEQRRRAEIELECNASGQINLTRRIFVSPHTLFVGTMNEDESTQTLSDKVIDRANVLRFGRPKKLDAHPDKADFLKACEGEPRLGAEDWDRWCKASALAVADGRIEFLDSVLTDVIPALDGVGRPYGYRVDTAMKTYVLNYPGEAVDAVADQIEMKILPKLNGLELEHPGFPALKAALEGAIARTDDEALLEAFAQSCPQGGTFFKWQGVAR